MCYIHTYMNKWSLIPPFFRNETLKATERQALSKITQLVISKVGSSGFHVSILEPDALELFIPCSAQALIKNWKRESEREHKAYYPSTVGPRVLGLSCD